MNSLEKTLEGTRVVTLALNLPGPVAAHRLAELGATIVKVEPTTGDPLELANPALYRHLHEKIEVHRHDLKSPDGRAALDRLLADSDVLLTSSRLAALQRLGLDWPELGRRYKRLCHVAIIGNEPPREQHPGHDLTYQAQKGLVVPPAMPRSLFADLGGSLEAVQACLALLYHRFRCRDLPPETRQSLVTLESAAEFFSLCVRWGLTTQTGVLGGALPQYNLYETSDGWIAIAALEPHFWTRLQVELGLDSPTRAELELVFQSRSAQQWQAWAEEKDLPIVAVCA